MSEIEGVIISIFLVIVLPVLIGVFPCFTIEFSKPKNVMLLPYKTFIKLYNVFGKCEDVEIADWTWKFQKLSVKYDEIKLSPSTHIGRYKFSRIVKKQQKDYVRQIRKDADVLALEQIMKMLNHNIKEYTTSVQQECKNIRNILNVH